jgi:lysophospholipase L1-like esterase
MNRLLCFFLACIVLLCGAAAPTTDSDKPTLYIVGDSTVHNSTKGQRGWGDEIGPFLDSQRITTINRARGGRSSRTFITEGLWDQVVEQLKPGDFVMIQFGHNDGGPLDDAQRARGSIRGIGDETKEIDNPITNKHEVVHTFGWYMSKYIADAKAKGATPIVLSYVPRCPKPGTTITPTTAPTSYALWAQQVAEREKTPFIDLYGISMRHYATIGSAETVKEKYFAPDNTHTNEAGAKRNAESVIEGVRELKDLPLASYLSASAASPSSSDGQTFNFSPSQTPPTFSLPLAEGNYDVTITFGDPERATSNTVKAETRRLMIEYVETKPGEFVTRTFTVNVRTPALPGGDAV